MTSLGRTIGVGFRIPYPVIVFSMVAIGAGPLAAVPPKPVLRRLAGYAETPQPARPVGTGEATAQAVLGPFNSFNVTLLSQVTPQSFSTNSTCSVSSTTSCANDIWGYVSPGGREYAILGLRTGTGFVDVTVPDNPFVVGAIADANSLWSDMRTYQHYAYNVNESGGGLQVFDLSLIDPPTREVTLVRSVTQSGLSTVHNLTLNVDSGYLYLCGSNLAGGRLIAVSLADPSNPVIVSQMVQSVYVHDAQVVTYTEGPYAGKEIAFCFCGSAGLKIVDVTNKINMFTLATLLYPNATYCHQGGLSEDRRFLFIDDELDELQDPDVTTTTTYVINVEDLSNPMFVGSFTSGLPSIDHNLFVRGNYVYEANYTSGLRIFDVTNPHTAVQVGWFDSYPFSNSASFNGNWGVYPFLPSGNVLISDQQGGLFVLDVSAAVGQNCTVNAPAGEPSPFPKNRYLSVTPGNPGQETALRVLFSDLPPPFEAFEGAAMWVDAPETLVDSPAPLTTIQRSRLTCSPVYRDWGSEGTIVISDDEIVPGGAYDIQQIRQGCNEGVEENYSAAVNVTTPMQWGDIIGLGSQDPPNGDANFVDVSALVDKFKDVSTAPGLASCDLYPSEPDGIADFSDISMCLDAFRGSAFPFAGPVGCP